MESIKTNIQKPFLEVKESFDDFDIEKYLADKELYIANDGVGHLKYINCPKCKNKGHIAFRDEFERVSLKECSCMIQRKILSNIEKSGMKSSFQKYRFDNFITKENWQSVILEATKKYITVINAIQTRNNEVEEKEELNWLVMSGSVGSGKTHLCTSVVDTLINQGYDIEYIPFISKLSSLQTRLSNFSQIVKDEAERELNRIKEVQVLYIDDFMKTQTVKIDLIFDIIDYRYRNNNLITIISTELSEADMDIRDVALRSRIKERTKGYWIHIKHDTNKNQRLKEN